MVAAGVAAPPPVQPLRWTTVVMYVAMLAVAAAGIFGALTVVNHWRYLSVSTIFGVFLLGFAALKSAIATDQLLAPPAVAPQSTQRQDTGSPGMFRVWLFYKYLAAVVAVSAAIWLLAHGSMGLDALAAPHPAQP